MEGRRVRTLGVALRATAIFEAIDKAEERQAKVAAMEEEDSGDGGNNRLLLGAIDSAIHVLYKELADLNN